MLASQVLTKTTHNNYSPVHTTSRTLRSRDSTVDQEVTVVHQLYDRRQHTIGCRPLADNVVLTSTANCCANSAARRNVYTGSKPNIVMIVEDIFAFNLLENWLDVDDT